MGKDNLVLGTARGKLGDVVFYRTDGEQRFRTRVRPTNPRTNAQLLQRVIVSTAAKAYSDVVEVCDHAFQNFVGKMKNQQRFLRMNIKYFREITLADVKSWSPLTWLGRSPLNYVEKDATYTVVNPYIVSEGDLPNVPVLFEDVEDEGYERVIFGEVTKAKEDLTYQDIVNALGLQEGDQLTFIIQTTTSTTSAVVDKTYISRLILKPASGDMNAKFFGTENVNNPSNVNDPNVENNGIMYFSTMGTGATKQLAVRPFALEANNRLIGAAAIITSRFRDNYWRRSTSRFSVKNDRWGINGIETAMESYLKETTSSLYLNQASRTRNPNGRTSVGAAEVYDIDELDNNQEIDIEQEKNNETNAKKSRK